MTASEEIRELHAQGVTRKQLVDDYGFARTTVLYALRTPGDRPAHRPRKLPRCEHCGQPIPAKLTG